LERALICNEKIKPDFPSENPAFILWQTTSLPKAGHFGAKETFLFQLSFEQLAQF
jgi:hypothetical protein